VPFYTEMIGTVTKVLGDLKAQFPGYAGGGYELCGFVWWHGWNDFCDAKATAAYEKNPANLIRDVRGDLKVPQLPEVIACAHRLVPGHVRQVKGDARPWLPRLAAGRDCCVSQQVIRVAAESCPVPCPTEARKPCNDRRGCLSSLTAHVPLFTFAIFP